MNEMNKITAFKILEDYQIWLQFQDGESKVVDFTTLIGKGISAPLLDKLYFNQVSLDVGGGLEWPNGMDFCPNFLKEYTSDLVVHR
jgi:hypothetical protein